MSNSRSYDVYIQDILEACYSIQEYTHNFSFSQFSADKRTSDAVIRNFGIIGEAAKKIPDEIRINYSHLNWRGMTGMRDKLIHDYSSVNLEIVWETIKVELPTLIKAFQKE